MTSPEQIKKAIDSATQVVMEESAAIKRLAEVTRSTAFKKAVQILLNCKGSIYILGMGKSGLVGQKIAATMTSIGAPSMYIHAGDALHGDLGAIRKGDVAILISKSGETKETLNVIPFLKDQGNPIIVIVNEETSSLATSADVTLPMKVTSEACPLNLAPMASSTATMTLGDALAAALIVARDFKPENFARFHPGGKLGFLLTANVADMIPKNANPTVNQNSTLREAVVKLVESRLGGISVLDNDGKLAGLITDGDLKRIIVDGENSLLDKPVKETMTKNPATININATATEAVEIMENRKSQIYVLPVVDDDHKPVGLLRLHDVIRSHM
ncbi:D-arabinose 5-phosphate isomerase [hydrothermal vent metagenome]|uniref:D-arabinose 5-phosphate isomerase n=1 Tax=hydrothermal vent metagenome TaxID=652676 RepID=A0A3B1D5B6_9ZZZZ